MPKPNTFPYIIDEAKNISISDLKKWKYLIPNSHKLGTITWRRNGIKTSSIEIQVIFREQTKEIRLSYQTKYDQKNHNYKIPLVSIPSNLGKGKIWFFRCSFTGVRCRKLHLIDGRFIHRSSLSHGMYYIQTYTKKFRAIEKTYRNYFDFEKLYNELNSKHFTKYYNGKPTKKYVKLKAKIEDGERFSLHEIERLFLY